MATHADECTEPLSTIVSKVDLVRDTNDSSVDDITTKVAYVQISSEKKNIRGEESLHRKCVRDNVTCIIESITANKYHNPGDTLFHGTIIPNIGISQYLKRIMNYTEVSDCAVISSLLQILNIYEGKAIDVSPYSIHRLLLAAVLVSAKFHDDFYFNNKYYAALGGIPVREMNKLEVEYLMITNFGQVDFKTYTDFYSELQVQSVHSYCRHELLPELKIDEDALCSEDSE